MKRWASDHENLNAMYTNWGAVILACVVTIYFFRQNLIGIHESSDKALKIMIATTIMAVIMLTWCGVTLAVNGPANKVPFAAQSRAEIRIKRSRIHRP